MRENNYIIDCFIFYNELDILKYRLSILGEYVDFFVLVESKKTFVNKEKKLFYLENIEDPIIQKYKNKIIHICLENLITEAKNKDEVWQNEYYQRNMINEGINYLNNNYQLKNDDIIIISDVDEIINPLWFVLLKDKKMILNKEVYSLEMDMYYYKLNFINSKKWYLVKLLNYECYKELGNSPQIIRNASYTKILKRGGWHLSYFGNDEFIINKIKNFSHQEYNNDIYLNKDDINNKINNGIDIFNRGNEEWLKKNIFENQFLPPLYYDLLKNYINFY